MVTTAVYRILQWRSGELDSSGEYSFPYYACFYASAKSVFFAFAAIHIECYKLDRVFWILGWFSPSPVVRGRGVAMC